jgi:hypothetical protein
LGNVGHAITTPSCSSFVNLLFVDEDPEIGCADFLRHQHYH